MNSKGGLRAVCTEINSTICEGMEILQKGKKTVQKKSCKPPWERYKSASEFEASQFARLAKNDKTRKETPSVAGYSTLGKTRMH